MKLFAMQALPVSYMINLHIFLVAKWYIKVVEHKLL